jgi:predicted nucleic acid-binding protein
MRIYADTSFILKLLIEEPGSTGAVALYRSMHRPKLFFSTLHQLEVANSIRHRAFHERRSLPSSQRASIKRELNATLNDLEKFIARGAFVETSPDLEAGIDSACDLSEKHTERLGCRGFDVLHVALALQLKCETFLTCDRIQGALAHAEGLRVTIISDGSD